MQLSRLRRDPAGLAIFQRLAQPRLQGFPLRSWAPFRARLFFWTYGAERRTFLHGWSLQDYSAGAAIPLCDGRAGSAPSPQQERQQPHTLDKQHGQQGWRWRSEMNWSECVTPFFRSFWSIRVPAKVRGDLHQVLPRSSRNSLIQ